MAELKSKSKNNRTIVKCKLTKKETINYTEIEVLNSSNFTGFAKINVLSKNKIEYTPSCSASVFSCISEEIDKYTFFNIVISITDIIYAIQSLNFNTNNLCVDLNNIFYNNELRNVSFIYLPITGNTDKVDLLLFFRRLGENVRAFNKSAIFVDDYINFLSSQSNFSVIEMLNYVESVCPGLIESLKSLNMGVAENSQSDDSTVVLNDSNGISYSNNSEDTVQLDSQMFNEMPAYNDEATMPLDEATMPLDEATMPLDNYSSNLSVEPNAEDTVLLNNSNINVLHKKACLVLRSTGEKNIISKNDFIIGSDAQFCDMVINNSNVSRSHLKVIFENDNYYIVDNNSTNGTLLNGIPVQSGVLNKIEDLDSLILGNEVVDFQILEEF